MSESNETPAAGSASNISKDKVGDILRKERLTRRITIETIAKDLKLNAGYIKALEASDYSSLPADPYVRVYIKSLTKYLSLDSDAIMKEFYKERGLISDAEEREGANKIDVSVRKQDKNPAVVVAIALVVILAVFAFVANKNGWITADMGVTTMDVKADTTTMPDLDAAQQSEDSLLAAMGNPDTVAAAAKQPARP